MDDADRPRAKKHIQKMSLTISDDDLSTKSSGLRMSDSLRGPA